MSAPCSSRGGPAGSGLCPGLYVPVPSKSRRIRGELPLDRVQPAEQDGSNGGDPMKKPDGPRFGRRRLLQQGMLAGLGLSALPRRGSAQSSRAGATVQRYATLGRTGMRISDIAIGEAVRGKRDRVYLTSKTVANSSDRRDSMMRALENSLRRLRTDYVDVYFNHAVNEVARMKNPEWREFTTRAKQQGKIRAVGMSGHAGNLIECLDYALDTDSVDVVLVAYNFGQDPSFYQPFTRSFDFIARQPQLPRVLQKAKTKGVGVVAMKTLMGAKLNDMRPFEKGGATFAQAAFRWVLSNPHVDALIVSMTSAAGIDEYVGASGSKEAGEDRPLLQRYVRANGSTQCRQGCAECLSACPYGVPINDVLRTRMYAVDYGDPELAHGEYALLGVGAAPCLSCAAQPCRGACPHGLRIERLLPPTHRLLTS